MLLFVSFLFLFFILLLFLINMGFASGRFSRYSPSSLGTPGLSVYPALSLESPILWLKHDYNALYTEKIIKLLKSHGSQPNCQSGDCGFNIDNLGPCALRPYGYDYKYNPICVYLMINKVFDWLPECYNNSQSLPLQIANNVKTHIQSLYAKKPHEKINQIWISCQGDKPSDRDRIGRILYYPQPSFDSNYFPVKFGSDQLPMVALVLHELKPGVLITVRCFMSAKNIPADFQMTFQIYAETDWWINKYNRN